MHPFDQSLKKSLPRVSTVLIRSTDKSVTSWSCPCQRQRSLEMSFCPRTQHDLYSKLTTERTGFTLFPLTKSTGAGHRLWRLSVSSVLLIQNHDDTSFLKLFLADFFFWLDSLEKVSENISDSKVLL